MKNKVVILINPETKNEARLACYTSVTCSRKHEESCEECIFFKNWTIKEFKEEVVM